MDYFKYVTSGIDVVISLGSREQDGVTEGEKSPGAGSEPLAMAVKVL